MTTKSSVQPRYLTVDQVCERWGIERSTVWRFRKQGMPSIPVGRLVRFDAEAVDAWILARGDAS